MGYIIAESKTKAIESARRLNKEAKYGYKHVISSIKYKGKAKTPGMKTYTVRKVLKSGFEQYRKG
jgi:hypothetical protein